MKVLKMSGYKEIPYLKRHIRVQSRNHIRHIKNYNKRNKFALASRPIYNYLEINGCF